MNYYQIVQDYWLAGDLNKAIELKQKCVSEGLLSDDELKDLSHVPTPDEYMGNILADPPTRLIPKCGRLVIDIAEKHGFTSNDIRRASGLDRPLLTLAKSGRLKKRSDYRKLTDGVVTLLGRADKL